MASIPRWLWSVLLLTTLPGCKTDDVVYESSQNAAETAYATCAMDAAGRLDDGISDPASIAMGVAGACSGQYARLAQAMAEPMRTEKGHAYVRDQMRTEELRLATTAVLTYRNAKREPPR
jgi:hypothetical protein